jgi:hypothetical protein
MSFLTFSYSSLSYSAAVLFTMAVSGVNNWRNWLAWDVKSLPFAYSVV